MSGRISAPGLAWLQLRREKVRLAVALGGVAFAVILIFMQLGFMDALFRSAVNVHEHLLADLVIVNPNYNVLAYPTFFSRRRLWQARAVDGVRAVSPIYTGVTQWKNPATGRTRSLFVLGVDPARPALDIPGLGDGLLRIRYPDVAVYDRFSRPEFGPVAAMYDAGREVVTEANHHQLTVKGLYTLGTSFGVDGSIVTSDLTFHHIFPEYPPGAIGIGLIRLRPGADPDATQRALAAALPRDVRVLTMARFTAQERTYWAGATPIGFVFMFGVVMGLVVGMIIVYQILFADITDHLSEYATLKAMGCTNRYLSAVVLMEASILSLAGYVPGMVVSWRLYDLTREATKLPMMLTPARAGLVLGLGTLMCWGSALIAMRKLRSADPAEVF